MNRIDNQQKMLINNIMQYQLATLDIALFLDTHPNDPVALQKQNAYSTQLRQLLMEYEKHFGPLNLYSVNNGDRWKYIDGPWPWEMEWDSAW